MKDFDFGFRISDLGFRIADFVASKLSFPDSKLTKSQIPNPNSVLLSNLVEALHHLIDKPIWR